MRSPALSLALILGVAALAGGVPRRPADDFGGRGYLTAAELDRVPVPADDVALGVHLPRTAIRTGDPAWAYFLVRNRTARAHDLDLRFDLHRDAPATVNGLKVHL